jgi:hypothetical protein
MLMSLSWPVKMPGYLSEIPVVRPLADRPVPSTQGIQAAFYRTNLTRVRLLLFEQHFYMITTKPTIQ